ncbi:MAG: PEP-CTERM sorting domain-containing protein [Planctomycetales bacterium]|nr:PEP-CTERM sorting domain-containing protein [Planctomycetales bacterium]
MLACLIRRATRVALAAGIALIPALVVRPSHAGVAVPVELSVGFDRWMYPFNATPGTRAVGLTFGALGEGDFDDRDSQTLVGFDTSSEYATGLPAVAYVINSAVVKATIVSDNAFIYDPTSDPFTSYNGGADADAGRPIELFGVATRNGFLGLDVANSGDPTLFAETTDFSPIGFPWHETRSAFASDYDGGNPRDVGNNVREGYDPNVWAVGQTDAVSAGSLVPANTELSFALDLGNPDLLKYLGEGLSSGALFFAITSFHDSTQGGEVTYPDFYLDAGGSSLGDTAVLVLDVSIASLPTGDANGDFVVDGLDYLVWAENFGDDPAEDPPGSPYNGDLDDNGVVDGLDYLVWAENFGTGTTSQAVPEPASWAGLAVALLIAGMHRRHRVRSAC